MVCGVCKQIIYDLYKFCHTNANSCQNILLATKVSVVAIPSSLRGPAAKIP